MFCGSGSCWSGVRWTLSSRTDSPHMQQMWSCVSGHLILVWSTPEREMSPECFTLFTDGVCLLCGAGQVEHSGFIRAFYLKTTACWVWEQGWWVHWLSQNSKVAGFMTRTELNWTKRPKHLVLTPHKRLRMSPDVFEISSGLTRTVLGRLAVVITAPSSPPPPDVRGG